MLRPLPPPSRRLCCLAAAVLTLTASGCGKPTGSISGKVTYRGNALPGGYVNYTGVGDSPMVKTSTIQSDGSYSISGMAVGPAKITVQGILAPVTPAQGKTPGVEAPQAPGRQTVYVPPQYSNTDTSGLTFTVGSGAQQHDIELK